MQKFNRLILKTSVSLALIGALMSAPVLAQEAGPSSKYGFAIPVKPLIAALADFTAVTGIQVVRPGGAAITGRSTPANGSLTPSSAIETLLHGTGLGYRFVSANTVAIFRPGNAGEEQAINDGSTVLSPIVVQGREENAWGPAQGFVARQSATATKTDTPLKETPQTVNVVTSAQMETLKPTRLAETLRYTPGAVTEVQPSTSYFDRIRLRGFYSINNVYLDGTQLTPSGSLAVAQADPALLERVEVLKGPASVLYGQNGAGGLINMVSKRPLGINQHEAGVGFGTNGYAESTVDLNGVAEDSVFSYRLAGVARKTELNNDLSKTKRYAIAPSVMWKPTDATSWTIMTGFQRDPEGNSSSYLPIKGMVLPNVNGRFPRNVYTCDLSFCDYDRKQAYISSDFRHDFSDALSFRQNLRLTRVSVDAQTLSPGALQADERTISRTALDQAATTRGVSIDNNLKYEFDLGATHNEMIAGFDYRRFTSDNLSAQGMNSTLNLDLFNPTYGGLTIPTLVTRTNNTATQQQYGLYAQNQMSIGDWRFMTGLRQDWASSDTDNHLTNATTETKDHALTGRAGLLYLFDNGLAPYVNYSTSFEPTSGTDYFGSPFKPTEGKQWEVGLKYEPTSFDGAFTVALFDLRRTNVTTADNAHTCAMAPTLADCGSYSIQTGEVRVRGLEFEGKVSLTDKLNASFGYAYMDAEVTSSNDGYEGKVPTNTPRHMASVWVDYRFDQGALDGLMIGTGVRYIGSMYADDANAAKILAYTLVDAKLSYDLGALSEKMDGARLAISVTNLVDRKAVGGCFSANYCDYVARRMVIGALNVKF
ncbi:TonB-dependent siderophore receptor [Rhizobiaceae bacterium BDR2-2]|uniref:TonB-dependent siderophore receptor n=1 Tax=Ectorhizobium quercum TaxID=2965071 RepID=A0AAE3SWT0_9HYPH|nr:TonB-dependent siderophore receptor [Ectorhizobium quercum]MCX8999740.1 TonB-dependent siderophore receptor [Ectorhizobium quercum]